MLRCSYVSLLLTVWTRRKYILISVISLSASAKQTDFTAKQEVSTHFSWANTDKHCLHAAAITLGDLQKSFPSVSLQHFLGKIVIWMKLSGPITSLSWELRNNEWVRLGDILAQPWPAILHFILNERVTCLFSFCFFNHLRQTTLTFPDSYLHFRL